MKIDLNATLREHNTFGFDVKAHILSYLTESSDIPEFVKQAQESQQEWHIIGGGSNLVLASDLKGMTGLMQILGRRLLKETATHHYVEAMAGESWHELVAWCLEQGYAGLENLALIPGTVGAAPIQNIGAYGLELAQVLDSLLAYDTQKNTWVTLTRDVCHFSYRDSVFKQEPNRLIVASITLALPKKWVPNLSYAELKNAFANQSNITPRDIFERVCAIRRSKLPDPKVIGNAGSFFHNPVVNDSIYQKLKSRFPDLVAYSTYPTTQTNQTTQTIPHWKLAAGWLIDQCGLKGYRQGSVGVYEKQALVLVNHGGGTGKELLHLAKTIQDRVQEKFGVALTIEPVILNQ